MTPTDWPVGWKDEQIKHTERGLISLASALREDPLFLNYKDVSVPPLLERAALALQTQRNLLAAAHARIAELEADLRDANTRPVA